eukprot:5584285-Amphidinium_carterae.1
MTAPRLHSVISVYGGYVVPSWVSSLCVRRSAYVPPRWGSDKHCNLPIVEISCVRPQQWWDRAGGRDVRARRITQHYHPINLHRLLFRSFWQAFT